MRTCEEHGNAIVVYDGHNCPVCEELKELAAQVGSLRAETDSLADQLSEANAERTNEDTRSF